jgi:ABC-type Mn2+/Zn2+ transport system permease subunit
LVFAERLIGQIFALLIGLTGIIGGSYVAVNGQPWAGGTIASISITGLAAVFLTGRAVPNNNNKH